MRSVFFDRHRDCQKFAVKLGAARDADMKGAANAYDESCPQSHCVNPSWVSTSVGNHD